jgi:hypothetical protein
MADGDVHGACVDAWLASGVGRLPHDRLLVAFEQCCGRIWRRANRTLGEVSLTAIVDRVLHLAAEQHPVLSALTLDAGGVHAGHLLAQADEAGIAELAAAVRFFLVELLTLIGTLTGEILTPALHAAVAEPVPDEDP